MKKIIYILTVITLLASCKSIDKMVDQGKYDEAILYAAAKLQGESNKKTKYVKALEEAFSKIMDRDLNQIKYLLALENDQYYDRIYDLYITIDRRQERIKPFLPLISKDGYQAKFRFIDASKPLAEAANKAANFHYDYGSKLLADGKKGNKSSARSAFRELSEIERYFDTYKDKEALMDTAKFIGTTRVNIDVYNDTWGHFGRDIEEHLLNSNLSGIQEFWTSFYLDNSLDIPMDYNVTIDLDYLDVDAGFERINTFRETAQIVKKEVPKKIRGKIIKDSLGNVVMIPVYKKVHATVTEIWREKLAELSGSIRVYDIRREETIHSLPVNVAEHFKDQSTTFIGDKRALSKDVKNRLDIHCAHLPSDYTMIRNISFVFEDVAFEKIKNFDWI